MNIVYKVDHQNFLFTAITCLLRFNTSCTHMEQTIYIYIITLRKTVFFTITAIIYILNNFFLCHVYNYLSLTQHHYLST